MKSRITLTFAAIMLSTLLMYAQSTWTQRTFLQITLDTKLMTSPDFSLGGGNGMPATANKVYAHLGLCTCAMIGTGINAVRDCGNTNNNKTYCYQQITPYRSNVWQHVVGNWGDNPQDDGIGLMTHLGNGVYTISFVIEDYFSNPALVNTQSAGPDVVPSTPWVIANGGEPHTIGMVFRNEDGTLSGRDDLGSDLFIVNLQGTPEVVQGSDPESNFPAITFVTYSLGVGQDRPLNKMLNIFPNPFNDKTYISYTLLKPYKNINIKIYDLLGKEVAEVYNASQLSGTHYVKWDGTDKYGNILPNGIYYMEINTYNDKLFSGKIIINR